MITYLAQTGVLCLGPTAGTGQMFVLTEEWVRRPRRLDGEQALGELALRFFRGHGPATAADLARWSGLTLTMARAGLAMARPQLATLEVDGAEYLLDPATPHLLAACLPKASGVFLLPGFDEFLLGYADRSAVLDPSFARRIAPGGNGIFQPTIIFRGRVAGTWRWSGTGTRRTVLASAFAKPSADLTEAIRTRASQYPS